MTRAKAKAAHSVYSGRTKNQPKPKAPPELQEARMLALLQWLEFSHFLPLGVDTYQRAAMRGIGSRRDFDQVIAQATKRKLAELDVSAGVIVRITPAGRNLLAAQNNAGEVAQ